MMFPRHPIAALWLLLLTLGVGVATPRAEAQAVCNDFAGACTTAGQSIWLGDMNNDGAVNQADADFWISCIQNNLSNVGTIVYCAAGDLNYDHEIDNDDLNYLNQLIALASNPSVGKLPKAAISEVRVRKPNDQTAPGIPQSRYVEIRTPTTAASSAAAPTVNNTVPGDVGVKRFAAGWFYIKVCRSSGGTTTSQISGTVAVVQPLNGMAWNVNPLDTASRGLSMMRDSSLPDGSTIYDATPVAMRPFIFAASGSLAVPSSAAGRVFPSENSTNVTHLLVFRNPAPGNTRAIPAVGQRVNVQSTVDPTEVCDLAWTVPGSLNLPPWDAIVDAVTIVRGLNTTNFGCIYADNGQASIGPVGSVSDAFAPPHIYRCRNAGSLTKGPNSITPVSDTPFARNPLCTSTVTGCGELDPNGDPRSCFEAQSGPSCSDADCCTAVCAIDPTCCSVVWDSGCAAQAASTCVQCGASQASCFVAHNTPSCSDSECCAQVCVIDPNCCSTAWDGDCVAQAAAICLSCGTANIGKCDEVHDLPYCEDSSCCSRVCQINPFCCAVSWDQTCVDTAAVACGSCGGLNTGSCCVVHSTPYCSDSQCCAAVCAVDPFCCSSTWDLSCTQIALIVPACGNAGCVCGGVVLPGQELSCFVVHEKPGCSDSLCCQTVCFHDPFCCFVTWDADCSKIANDLCSTVAGCISPLTGLPVNGSCYIAHLSPGCDKPGCCSQVCAEITLAYCCQLIWDEACAIRASQVCDQCGDPLAGSCYQQHDSPNCADATCCSAVCNIDPFCCTDQWDELCVGLSAVQCSPPIDVCGVAGRSCWIPNYTPGCNDSTCCVIICRDIDPFCCEARWDAVCAREATFICTPTFIVTIGREGCLNAHDSPGCANADCSRAVCSVDPSCCTTQWDQGCVLVAVAVCPAPEACPATGNCFAAHATPGCKDATCCNGVCNLDPSCCQGEWDAECVGLARDICKVPAGSGWTCPCQGDCFEPHDNPGCKDGSCCSIVCNLSPVCCDALWDADCVSLAREYCCGSPGCGSGCNKSCLLPHQEPYCDDPYCCDAVCRADPLCCVSGWDSLCVVVAVGRCSSACGLLESGDCFVEHDLPSCNNGACCSAVCRIDPACCSVAWDTPCVTLALDPNQATQCIKPVCGDPNAGSSCEEHPGQASSDPECCTQVCAEDSYCCDTEWDSACVEIARGITICGCSYECGDTCAGSCCRAHDTGSCDDPDCCKLVCAQDSYCCDTQWDSVCASTARSTCSGKSDACPLPPCGSDLLPSCCVVSPVPNCSDATCCARVCASDPFCCETQWDSTCVNLASQESVCGCDTGGCGDPDAGNCFQVHATPFCNETGCCQTVCAYDPTCCDSGWDADCVQIAQFFCGSGFTGLLDAYRGGPLTAGRGGRAQPPAGWIPPRERAQMRQSKPAPPSIPMPKRPATELKGLPRSDGIEILPSTKFGAAGKAPASVMPPEKSNSGMDAPAGKQPK